MNSEVNPYFEKLSEKHISSLNLKVEAYRHKTTGTPHYHLAADNNENVMLIGLRTVPTDSTGVAHILEHTALCGSKNYPVRDPFFMMIRRSLNTFMNAMTSSDWTAYPFASQNKKDFENLTDVYLDAVFFSNLNELDFAQEGHRLEFEETENPTSELVYKGVVYNEMKGAMSSPISVLWQTLTKNIFPTVTYHYNSGGEPENIPDLTYDQLKSFYQTHYHPSNALFFTFGDIPAIEHQQRFHEKALQEFEPLNRTIFVPPEKRFDSPKMIEDFYAVEEGSDLKDKTHVVVGWLLGESADLESRMKATLLSSVLLDNASSPLRFSLENSKLGQAPSPLCGLEDSNKEMIFMCGLEGSNAEQAEEVQELVLEVLRKSVSDGIDAARLDAALHQLELSQKEITGGSYPYGLQLIMDMLSVAVHKGDPVSAIDTDAVINRLREESENPDFFPKLVDDLLLKNPHRICLVLKPDPKLNEQKVQREKSRLASIKSELTEKEKQAIIAQAKALLERQERVDDESILPKVGVEDIPKEMYIAHGEVHTLDDQEAHVYIQGTNGIVYQQLAYEIPQLSPQEWDIFPLYTRCLGELGSGGRNYLETQALMDQVTGGISGFSTIRSTIDDIQQSQGYLFLSGKALLRNHDKLADLMLETMESLRFDELDRIAEIVAQARAQKENSITGNGHSLAMTIAASGMSPVSKLKHDTRGLTGIKKLKALDDSLEKRSVLEELATTLSGIHQRVLASVPQILLIGEEQSIGDMLSHHLALAKAREVSMGEFSAMQLAPVAQQVKEFWVTNTQINFVSKAYPTVPVSHTDAPALMVLGGFMKNGFLHRVIREQGGAYGGGATYDSDAGAFKFYSYRDPRLLETLADYDRAIDWMLSTKHDASKLEEAILGVISSFDKPSSPAGEAKNAYQSALFGRSPEQRQKLRASVLDVTLDDLKRITETYLKPSLASVGIVSQQSALDKLGDFEAVVNHL